MAPARPNGIPIHSVDMSVEQTNTSNVVTSSYSLTFVPATCESSLPLLTVSLVDGDQANSGNGTLHLCMPFLCYSISFCICRSLRGSDSHSSSQCASEWSLRFVIGRPHHCTSSIPCSSTAGKSNTLAVLDLPLT